jgi:hypothetical protein
VCTRPGRALIRERKSGHAAIRAIVHLSGGQVPGPAFGVPVAELHAVGRTSGQPRLTMLTAPVIEGDRVVLVALQGRR